MKRLLAYIILFVMPVLTSAQQFQKERLSLAAKKLQLDSAALLTPGIQHVKVKERELVVRITQNGMVEHIGIPLFNESLQAVLPSPIYDFLEYATLDHHFRINDNSLHLQDIKFEKGSWEQMEQLSDSLPCTIDNEEGKRYKVTWYKPDGNELIVSFPVNYELLANSTRRELERNFVKGLAAYHDSTTNVPIQVDVDRLKPSDTEGVFISEGTSYIIPAINNNIYVQKGKEGKAKLIFDNRLPAQSLANILVSPSAHVKEATIELTCNYSTHQTETFTVSLQDFLSYCRQERCTPYFGYEGTSKGNAEGTLLMSNPASGYDHIIHLVCPVSDIGNDLKIQARMFFYTPSSNVKNLFADKNSHSKSIIIWK